MRDYRHIEHRRWRVMFTIGGGSAYVQPDTNFGSASDILGPMPYHAAFALCDSLNGGPPKETDHREMLEGDL